MAKKILSNFSLNRKRFERVSGVCFFPRFRILELLFEVLNPGLNVNVILAGVQIDSRAVWSVAARLYVPTSLYRYRHI